MDALKINHEWDLATAKYAIVVEVVGSMSVRIDFSAESARELRDSLIQHYGIGASRNNDGGLDARQP